MLPAECFRRPSGQAGRTDSPSINLIEPPIKFIEPPIKLIEPPINLIEPPINLIEPPIKLIGDRYATKREIVCFLMILGSKPINLIEPPIKCVLICSNLF